MDVLPDYPASHLWQLTLFTLLTVSSASLALRFLYYLSSNRRDIELKQKYASFHVQYLLFLSHLKQILIWPTDFIKNPQFKMLGKAV